MEIHFRTRKLKRIFDSDRNLDKKYGPRMAIKIRARLAVLGNAPALSGVPTVPPERCHLLGGDMKGQYALDLVHPYRLIIQPNHDIIPMRETVGIDTQQVTSIEILGVVDYH